MQYARTITKHLFTLTLGIVMNLASANNLFRLSIMHHIQRLPVHTIQF
jgi:hypothetical protein